VRILRQVGIVLAFSAFAAWAQLSAPVITSVCNEGSTLPSAIAPGMLVILVGSNLASSTGTCNATTPLPLSCNGVSVLVNGKAAPVDMVFVGEVHFQVPFGVTGTTATIQVTNQSGVKSAPVTVAVVPVSPAFMVNGGGSSGLGELHSASGVAITALNPARPGDTVSGLGTGFGATNPVVADGAIATPPASVVAPVTVTVGGENSKVLLAEMNWPGQYRVVFTLPGDLPGGNLPVAMNAGGVNTQAGVVIPVCGSPVAITGVSNNASGGLAVASGSWVSIYGTNLSCTTRPWQASDFSGSNLPLALNGVGVKIDGKDAAVWYVSPGQINVQVPTDTAAGAVPVTVSNAGTGTASGTLTLAAYAPGFFQSGQYVASVHADGAYVAPAGYYGSGTASRPATPGETVLLFGTGFGPTTPAVASGVIFNGAAPLTDLTQLHVTIGGAPATVSWAGLVAAGEYQFNVVIPPLPDGDQMIAASVAGVSAQNGLKIAVKN